jgi:tetratricopeptide (TPR) repeat protein
MKTFFFASYTLLLCAIFSLVSTSSVNAQSELKGSGTLIEEGIKVYDTGNYKQAIKFYAQVPEGDTNYLLAQYEMGLAYNADSQFTLARNLAIKALEHPDAETRLFLLLLGNTYDYLGKQDSAIQCYDQLLARNPNDYQVYYEMGILHLRKERMDSTIYYLEKAIMLNPYHFRSLKVLGSCYGLQGRLTEA